MKSRYGVLLAQLLAVVALGAPAHAVADRAHPFRLPEVLLLGDQPSAIACGDFDRDGREDFALTLRADSTVHVHRGRSDGALAAALRYPFHGGTAYTSDLLAGDVDGDGWQDLVIVEAWSGAHAVHSLRNDGAGDFEPDRMMQVALPALSALPGAGLGDADGDDRADVVVLGAGAGDALFLRSLGASGFASPVTLSHPFALKLAKLADANGDGLADVIVAGPSSVAVRLALGGGAWAAPLVSAIPGVLAVADQDGDGRSDLWVFGETRGAVHRGVGDGTFTTPAVLPGSLLSGLFPFVRDLDGDGLADALLNYGVSPTTGVYMYLGAPDGSLPMRGIWGAGANSLPAGLDFDGDGVPDLATAARDGLGLRIARGLGAARFHAPSVCRSGRPGRVAVTDLDGDARAELLIVGSSPQNRLDVYRGDAGGLLPLAQSQGLQSFPFALALADLDGDEHTDAFVTSTDDGWASQCWLRGHGDGTFASTSPLSGETGSSAWQAVAGDIDGDGVPDLLTDGGVTGVRIAWGQGGGAFDPLAGVAAPAGRFALTKAPGDPSYSLVVAGDSLRVVRFGADRSWTTVSAAALAAVPADMVTAQAGGDALPDLVMAHAGARAVEVRVAIGTQFGEGVSYACGSASYAPYGLAVGDVDGDGYRDLVVSNAYASPSLRGGIVTVWYNTGTGAFTDRTEFDPGGYLTGSCALGDVNGDGALDLAVANGEISRGGNDVLVLLNAAAPPTLAGPGPGAAARFSLDLAWPNPLGRSATLNLRFSLPVLGDVRVELLDVQGRRVLARELGSFAPGSHSASLVVPAGPPELYFVRLVQGAVSVTRRVVRTD